MLTTIKKQLTTKAKKTGAYKRQALSLKIHKGKPEMVSAKDYLKAMKQWEFVLCTKAVANRFHPASAALKVKIRTKKIGANRYKVIKL